MKKFLGFIFAGILFCAGYAWGDNYTLEGDMGSNIRFSLERQLKINPDVQQIILSFVIPPAFSSPTGKQGVENFKLSFSPSPDKEKRKSDLRGNQIVESTWMNPPEAIDVRVQFNSRLDTDLKRIDTTAAFPMGKIPNDIGYYLTGTNLVQKDHPRIAELASSLTKGATTQYEAVGRIMAYVVDKIHYVNPAEKYDAVYTFPS
jgi:transglutaminase-like putative cysteine protease